MKNEDVVKGFMNHRECKNRNMCSMHNKLYSYSTCIAQWSDDKNGVPVLYINNTKYSQTTSKHCSYVKHQARYYCKIVFVENVPRNSTNLIKYAKNYD